LKYEREKRERRKGELIELFTKLIQAAMVNGRVREVSGEALRQGVLGEGGSCPLYSRARVGWVGGPDTVTR